ncbi:hypothetical protein Q7C36_003861 [Tachysurus vachellii]|uniref:AIG1-type G domain-containing protein n=1 Tax=Tachysurus vachellii TaxID=175792 RepID=A0AA88NQQ0_TACVA|nr:hypothetical protein Q7C36_003861 [Tachysurus vachellii]
MKKRRGKTEKNTKGISRDEPDTRLKRVSMSELRIVLLGKSLSHTSSLGNLILGNSVFETEDSPHLVKQCKSVSRQVDGRNITIINAPHLFDPQLSQEELSQRIRDCVLHERGPHVFLLVVQPHDFTEEDRNQLRRILNNCSDEAIKSSIVITVDGKMKYF